MGPSRKRPRTTPPTADETASTKPADGRSTPTQPSTLVADSSSKAPSTKDDAAPGLLKSALNDIKAGEGSSRDLKPKSSWYGTWPRKPTASTQVARETILADKPTNGQSSTDLSRFEPPRKGSATMDGRPPSMLLGKSKETSDITMGGTLEAETIVADKPDKPDKLKERKHSPSVSGESKTHLAQGTEEAPPEAETQKEPEKPDITQRPATSSGWLGGWLGRPNTTQGLETGDDPLTAAKPLKAPPTTEQQAPDPPIAATTAPIPESAPPRTPLEPTPASPVSTSWFGLWSTAAPTTVEKPKEHIPVKVAETDQDTVPEDVPVAKPSAQPAPGSSWAFWSTETNKKVAHSPEAPKYPGQLAVAGETSQDKPEPAQAAVVTDTKKGKSAKRGGPLSTEIDEATKEATNKTIQLDPTSSKGTPSQSPAAAKKSGPPNLLMPSVKGTYRLIENPSILQQIVRLILHDQQQPSKHVYLVKDTPKIKKALAIGIHGLFPAPLLRTVIGQPTGTSIRFANHAAAAIRRWGDQHGCVDCEIEKVALEGEGKIAERVDNLWKLLLNWIDHVRKADFILVACHSQGVPVALMLVAKLIEFGVVNTSRIGVCAMAGVSLGPFPDYKSRLFSGSAGELFEFADPESTVTKRYEDALRIAVKYGVRVTYCGSIDDQLVSMESSIFSTATHPYIYRAVFVDGRIHAPNFLSHLIGFALKLRNLGVSDHGLIRELSVPLAGSLYTGEGHSRLYDDEKVYDLATEYALETTSVGDVPLEIKKYEIPSNANPFVLPWIMRGLLEEEFVKTELDDEVTELLKQFDEWKPATKVLKDVKYRLEAVRSKL